MPRRYLSLWLPHWATDRWQLHQTRQKTIGQPAELQLKPHPAVAIASSGGRRLIMAANEAAMREQLTPGLSLADALARYPELVHFEADPADDTMALRRLAFWCQRFSPLVAVDGLDGVMIDITGCAHLWQGEDKLRQDLLVSLRRRGFVCRAGIADTIGGAWAVARFQERSPIVTAQEHKAALAALPVEGLRVDSAVAEGLKRLGLRSIGDLYPLPRAALAKRFGRLLIDRLDQALGDQPEPFNALLSPPAHRVSLTFAEPVGTPEDIDRAMHILAERLSQDLTEQGSGARRVRLSCYRLDHQTSEIGIGLSLPTATAKHLVDLLAKKLDRIDPGPGIEQIMLTAQRVEPLRQYQADLEKNRAGTQSAMVNTTLAPLIDRLANRLGPDRIFRLAAVESHIPERAVAKADPLSMTNKLNWNISGRIRPIRLLTYPEPVEVMAPVPDDPPIQFRWRHVLHRVLVAEGPERITDEWWRRIGITANQNAIQGHQSDNLRDYYRVEDTEGRRFWLYRAGLYDPDHAPRWFMHGLFA
ncbi:DNA polymerase Y family protein [Dongia soli]|uniref:DNA-directed DNA polymerase n=1 Tax=Dongia soli TaxID=600628 RepID=A0ABU5E9T1_9PROT|nr:DNA polymerase Y family protein [Dongia soli]MDY0882621.1 DNA polymerase Y family protein [Dongia soli]